MIEAVATPRKGLASMFPRTSGGFPCLVALTSRDPAIPRTGQTVMTQFRCSSAAEWRMWTTGVHVFVCSFESPLEYDSSMAPTDAVNATGCSTDITAHT
jgi:hypothetical protein